MKKILSIVIIAMMLVSCLSLSVFAADDNYAWQFNDQTGAYLYINDYGDTACIIEFDLRFETGGEGYRINKWMGNGMVIEPQNDRLGVGDTTMNYSFNVSTWYHLKFDGTAAGGTDIYVNKTKVGTVGSSVGSMQCLGMVYVTIDNFEMTVNGNKVIDEDFQDKRLNGFNSDTGGDWVLANDIPDWDAPTPGPDDPGVHTHTWDGGVISGNYIIYTCTGCGETRTEDYNPNDLGWWLRMDGYAHIMKNVDRCEGVAVTNCGYVDFDLIMLPGSDGHCKIRFFDSWEGTTRTYLEDSCVGYHYPPTEAESFSAFSWGAMTVDNVRHIRYAYTDEDVTLYVDGNRVYTNGYGCTPAMNGMIFNVESGSAIIDNLVFSDTKGNTIATNDFESSAGDSEGCYRVHLGDCANGNHVAENNARIGRNPTCTEDGYRYWACSVCGLEARRETIEKLGHNFGVYADGVTTKAATATADGIKTWTCKRCSAATATGVIPATGDYTGTIVAFDDASDVNVTKYVLKGFNFEAIEEDENDGLSYPGDTNNQGDGYSYINERSTANYHEFIDVDTSGYTLSFDFRLNETFDTSDTEGYGHRIFIWGGGQSNVANEFGYDFDAGAFFCKPWQGTNYDPIEELYELEADKWYNITISFYSNKSTYESWVKMYVNGTQVLAFDDDDASFELPYAKSSFPLLVRNFGVDADFTNVVIGDANFRWTNFRTPANPIPHDHVWGAWVTTTPAQIGVAGVKTRTCTICGKTETAEIAPLLPYTAGDANGDNKINSKDLKLVKQFIVGDVDETEIQFDAVDLNGDGKVNSKDAKLLKQLIANA
ncbi:MAG: dockerin type I repeat-containing protein [Clostridia bacterium]|nr:dockerin type I repeat-containing protein [Clostridia bacterium]